MVGSPRPSRASRNRRASAGGCRPCRQRDHHARQHRPAASVIKPDAIRQPPGRSDMRTPDRSPEEQAHLGARVQILVSRGRAGPRPDRDSADVWAPLTRARFSQRPLLLSGAATARPSSSSSRSGTAPSWLVGHLGVSICPFVAGSSRITVVGVGVAASPLRCLHVPWPSRRGPERGGLLLSRCAASHERHDDQQHHHIHQGHDSLHSMWLPGYTVHRVS